MVLRPHYISELANPKFKYPIEICLVILNNEEVLYYKSKRYDSFSFKIPWVQTPPLRIFSWTPRLRNVATQPGGCYIYTMCWLAAGIFNRQSCVAIRFYYRKFTMKKLRCSARWRLLSSGLRPWRSTFFYLLNMQLLCKNYISISAQYWPMSF